MSWSFRPSAVSLLAVAAGCALTLYLAVWQIHRGRDKQALELQYAAAAQQPPVELKSAAAPPAGLAAVAASADGCYEASRQLLLDDQVQNGVPGYDVWTPLRLADGGLLIVNRGWVPQGPSRRALPPLPAPDGPVQVHGLWRALPVPGLRLGPACAPGQAPVPWPQIALYPTAADLNCYYGEPVLAGELLLAPDAPDGFVRDWRVNDIGFPPSRHYGYAAQWFALCLTLLVLFIKFNLKRNPTKP
jgi:surfeit locus 1 family protein